MTTPPVDVEETCGEVIIYYAEKLELRLGIQFTDRLKVFRISADRLRYVIQIFRLPVIHFGLEYTKSEINVTAELHNQHRGVNHSL